jgi:hypothetical protein
MKHKLAAALATACAVLAGLLIALPAEAGGSHHRHRLRPVVFVHGFFGSAGQYETPARRFASNGYPARYVEAHEYDSTFATTTREAVWAALDQRIDRLRRATGASQVDLVGHSLGTAMSQGYLNSAPERAARVAHYVNLDGASAAALPGGVPTLAIWGEGDQTRAVAGARNVYLPDQSHTQSVTSAESFAEQFRFLTGRSPRTTRVVPERSITLAGRAVLFPSNAGAAGATVSLYRVDPRTGQRLRSRPVATFPLGADGAWGPVRARGSASYEFAITRPGSDRTHHLYFPPFRRTDLLVRLLTSEPGTGLDALTEKSPRHTNLTILRNKEWWGDQVDSKASKSSTAGDTLTVNGTSILSAGTAPRTKRAIGVFAYDAGVDGVSHPDTQLPAFAALPFISGVDLFVPASPGGVVRLASHQRGTRGTAVVNVPAWPSDKDLVSVQFDDYGAAGGRAP